MATKTWIGGVSGHETHADEANNWSPSGIPGSSDDVVMDSNATYSMDWNVVGGTIASLTVASNTPSGKHLNPTSNLIITGDFTINAPYYLSGGGALLTYAAVTLDIGGNFTMCSNSYHETGGCLTVHMNGHDKTVSVQAGLLSLYQFRFEDDTYITHFADGGSPPNSSYDWYIASGKTVTLSESVWLKSIFYWGATWSNDGTIVGNSTNKTHFMMYNQDRILTLGTLSGDIGVLIENHSTASTENRICYLGANTSFTGALEVRADAPTYTMELNHYNNYTLSCGALTLGTRGKMTQGTGTWAFASYTQNGSSSVFTQGGAISCFGNFSLAAGTFSPDSTNYIVVGGDFGYVGGTLLAAMVEMTGTGKTATWSVSHQKAFKLSGTATVTLTDTLLVGIIDVGSGTELSLGGSAQLYWKSYNPGASFTNDGTITGTGNLIVYLYNGNTTWMTGTIDSPVIVRTADTSAYNCACFLGANTYLGSSLTVESADSDNTAELHHGTNFTLDVAGATTLGTRGKMTQGTGTWTFANFTMNASSAYYDQNGEMRAEGTVNISNGIWNCDANAIVDFLVQSGGNIDIEATVTIYYKFNDSYTGGTRTGSGQILDWAMTFFGSDTPFELVLTHGSGTLTISDSNNSAWMMTRSWEWSQNQSKRVKFILNNNSLVAAENLLSGSFDGWSTGTGALSIGDKVDYKVQKHDFTTGVLSWQDYMFHGFVTNIKNLGDGRIEMTAQDWLHRYDNLFVPQTYFANYHDRTRCAQDWDSDGYIFLNLPSTGGHWPGVLVEFACDDEVFKFGTESDWNGDGNSTEMNALNDAVAAPFIAETDGTYGWCFWGAWDYGSTGWTVRVSIQTDNAGAPSGTEVCYGTYTPTGGAGGSNFVKGYWYESGTDFINYLTKGKKYWMVWKFTSWSTGAKLNIQRLSTSEYTDWDTHPRYFENIASEGWHEAANQYNLCGGIVTINYEIVEPDDYEFDGDHHLKLWTLPGTMHPEGMASYYGSHVMRGRVSYYYNVFDVQPVLEGLIHMDNECEHSLDAYVDYDIPLYRTRGKNIGDCLRELVELRLNDKSGTDTPYQGTLGHYWNGSTNYIVIGRRISLNEGYTPVKTFAHYLEASADEEGRIITANLQMVAEGRPGLVIVKGKGMGGSTVIAAADDRAVDGSWYNKNKIHPTKSVYDESLNTPQQVRDRAFALLRYTQRDIWEGQLIVSGVYPQLLRNSTAATDGAMSGEIIHIEYAPLAIDGDFRVTGLVCKENTTEIQVTNRDILYENYLLGSASTANKSEAFLSPDDPQETLYFVGYKNIWPDTVNLWMQLQDTDDGEITPRIKCSFWSNSEWNTCYYQAWFPTDCGYCTDHPIYKCVMWTAASGGSIQDTFNIDDQCGVSYRFWKRSTTGVLVELHYRADTP